MEPNSIKGTTPLNNLPEVKKEKTEKVAKKNPTIATEIVDKQIVDSSGFDVQLSERARDLAEARKKALEIARNTPDIREDKVAELKKRLQSGSYKIDPEKIADGMLREAIKDHLATTNE